MSELVHQFPGSVHIAALNTPAACAGCSHFCVAQPDGKRKATEFLLCPGRRLFTGHLSKNVCWEKESPQPEETFPLSEFIAL